MHTINQNLVSIIVPAYNAEKTIRKTLEGLLNQAYLAPMEIVVVDDGSKDNTRSIVSGFNTIKYVYQDNAGPASARNKGFYNSAGKIVFFTDADCIPRPDWISTVMTYFCDPGIGIVAGSYGMANPDSLLARCIYQEIIFRHKTISNTHTEVFGSYNVAIRRGVLESLGGFNEQYKSASGEDNDLSYRMKEAGHVIKFVPESRVDHFHPEKIGKYLKEQFNHGFWRVKIYLDHPLMVKGDGYTFWKDSFETFFIMTIFVIFVLTLWGILKFHTLFYSISLLALMECIYGIKIMKSFWPGIYFAFVMLLRAWARTIGCIEGLLFFLPQKFFPRPPAHS